METLPVERSPAVGVDGTAKVVQQCRREVVVDDSGKHLVGCPSKTKQKPKKATINKSKESNTKVLNSDAKNKVNTNESKKKHKIENSFKYPAVSLVDPKAKGKQGKGTGKTSTTQQSKSAGKKQQTKKVKFDNSEVISSKNLENSSTKDPLLLLKKKYECANFFAPEYLQSSSVQEKNLLGNDCAVDKVEDEVEAETEARRFDSICVVDKAKYMVETETEGRRFDSSCEVNKTEYKLETKTEARHFDSCCVVDKAEHKVETETEARHFDSDSVANKANYEIEAESKMRHSCSDTAAYKAEHENETEHKESERTKGVNIYTTESFEHRTNDTEKQPTAATENLEGKVCRIYYDVDASIQENNKKNGSSIGENKVCLGLSSPDPLAVNRDPELSSGKEASVQIEDDSGQIPKAESSENVQIMHAACTSATNYPVDGVTSATDFHVSSNLIYPAYPADNKTSSVKYCIVSADGAGADTLAAYAENSNFVDVVSSDCVALAVNGSAAAKSINSTIVAVNNNSVVDTQPAGMENTHHAIEGESCVVTAGRRYSSDEGYAEDQSRNVSVDCESELCQFQNPNGLINCENKKCGEDKSQDVASECSKEPGADYYYQNKLTDCKTEPSSENQSQNLDTHYENKVSFENQIHNLATHFEGEDCGQNAITNCNATNQNLPLHSFHDVTKNINYLSKDENILFQKDAHVLKTTDDTQNRDEANEVIKADNDLITSRYSKTSLSSYDTVPTGGEGNAVRPKRKDDLITVNDKLTAGLNSTDNILTEAEFKVNEDDVSASKNKKIEMCEDQLVFCPTSDCADVNVNIPILPEGAVNDSFYNCVYYPNGLISIPQQPENTRPCEVILKRLSSRDVQRKSDLEERIIALYRSLHDRTRNVHITIDIQEEIRKCEDQYEDFLNEYLDFPSR